MNTARETRLSELFVELADTLTADFDVVDLLTRLATQFAELLPADEAGVLLTDPQGQLHLMASSTEQMRMLELYELQTDEGPCLEAHRAGRAIVNVTLADAGDRWTHFTPRATEGGFTVVHAFPMRLRERSVGVLNAFSREGPLLTADEIRIGQALAAVATIGILQERALREARVVAEQLQHALTTRVVIEQAKGVVAERAGIEMGEAFELLRSHARRTSTRLGEIARAVVSGTLSVDELRRAR